MQGQPKLFGDEEERAVSPVIGVILMVAITVILAAVIAATLTGFTDNIAEPGPDTQVEVTENSDWSAGGSDNELYHLTHIGGESLDGDSIEVVLRNEDGGEEARVIPGGSATSIGNNGDYEAEISFTGEFGSGATMTMVVTGSTAPDAFSGSNEEITVVLIDGESGSTIQQTTFETP